MEDIIGTIFGSINFVINLLWTDETIITDSLVHPQVMHKLQDLQSY